MPALPALLRLFFPELGLALPTAAVYLRDVRFFTDVAVLLLMFLTPVFYSQDVVPPQFVWIFNANPLATLIVVYWQAFLSGVWPGHRAWGTLVTAAAIAAWAVSKFRSRTAWLF